MKKFLLLFLSAAIILSLAACGKGADNGGDSTTMTPAEIEQKIADAVGKDNYLCDTEIDKDTLQNVYRLDLSKVESYAAKQNSVASVNPDTVIVLKAKDGYAADAVKALKAHYKGKPFLPRR